MLVCKHVSLLIAVGCISLASQDMAAGLSRELPPNSRPPIADSLSRRGALAIAGQLMMGGAVLVPEPVSAAADCFSDCLKSCKLIAPKDLDYCTMNCKDYCSQEDRADGLSGSVSSSNGEVGILGGTFGQGTVPKGEDKPPTISIPGLDFNSEKGKKLLGY